MPFVPNTPESLIRRSDSKDPGTTCRGITGSGRPCRNAITPETTLPKTRKNKLHVVDPRDPNNYCWRHKDQANASASSSPGTHTFNTPILEERTSIDTLAGRLGILSTSQSHPKKPQHTPQPSGSSGGSEKPNYYTDYSRPPKPAKELSFCCFRIPIFEEEPAPPPRPHPHPVQVPATSSGKPSKYSSNHPAPTSSGPLRPSMSSQTPSGTSQTSQYLSLIPPDCPPATASSLMAELAKPVSKQDVEGYIYIFWLTPESQLSQPSTETARSILEPAARSLLEPPSPSRPAAGRKRRPSDVLASFADTAGNIGTRSPTTTRSRALSSGDDKRTLLLKIGRATNVQRRMNEWKRQCGYDLSLIRFYPYIQSGSGVEPRKMPHSHKVERLIHLELQGLGMRLMDRGPCEACGKEHKEWFEVDASREGIMRVDEAIRRWVDWDEGRTSS